MDSNDSSDVIDTTDHGAAADDQSVLDLILNKPEEAKKEPVAKEEVKAEAENEEEKPKPRPEGEDEREDEENEEDEADEKEGEEESDDLDAYLVDVTVDGKIQEVKLGDLKKSFSGTKYIEANVQKAVEARKAAENQANTLFEVNNQARAKLENLDKILKIHAEPNIDWETLKKSDPSAYLLKREEVRDAQQRQALVRQEVARIDSEQAEIEAHAMQEYLDNQAQVLVRKLPILGDAKQAPKLMADLEDGARTHYGYTKQEFSGIVDHRAMMVLHDAVKWRESQAQKKEVRTQLNEEPEKKVLLRPSGTKSSQSSVARKLDQAALKRARESGKAEDVAATLIVRKKG